MIFELSGLAISLLACVALLSVLIRRTSRLPVDLPNDRSLHATPTPRIGGLGILFGIITWFALFGPQGMLAITLPTLGLAVISLMDDYFGLPAGVRLPIHMIAAVAFIWFMGISDWVVVLIAFFLIVWMTNLYNFMDGTDGLAGGMALFGFGAYGFAAWHAGMPDMAWMNWAIAAAALGFLVFNFPPAQVFMGDAGSIPLGFLAGALGVSGWEQKIWPVWFPVLVFSPFLVDATVTLVRRGLRGERIWQAHKSHYYQRLVRLGMTHRQLALLEYALMICAAASAVWISFSHPERAVVLLACWIVLYFMLGASIDRAWHRKHGHAL
jgi:UDP-N-acetylmuramyl pentapeptide phosphotransferase/UDP-N-acetylglucosamine-1-phosphate transferase